ncbi:MAG: LamG domain-containing protein [Bdellovibrionaceae bacterium]|nr:LamG domain-containing protein [Bdellovibrio sp.]
MLVTMMFLFGLTEVHAQMFLPFSNWRCSSSSAIHASGDSTNANFSAGTLSNAIVTGFTVSLAVAATSGTLTSRTFDIFQSCIQFSNFLDFSWKTSMPFLKELPVAAEAVVDYPSVLTTLQTNLIGYWRFNETAPGGYAGPKDFKDFSPSGNNIAKTGTITLGASGRFLNGVSSNNTGGYVDLTGVNTLIGTTASYTISAWFNVTSYTNGCSGTGTYLLDRAITGGGNPLAGICIKTNSFAFETRCDNGASLQQVVGAAVVTGSWQHVVIQRDRAAALYRIFGNGVQIATVADGAGCAVTLDPPRLARHATGTTQGLVGSLDEVLIWNRALSPAEILQLYRRGGNRLEFQFRTCTSPTCADNPAWQGPDGTATTYFSELYNNSIQATGMGTVLTTPPTMTFINFAAFVLARKRYFQYKGILNSDSTSNTPDFNWTYINW